MTFDDGRLFLVEQKLPKITESDLSLLQAALADACVRLTARGQPVSYIRSTFLPRSERLLSLFRAADAEAVRSVSQSSQAPLDHLEVAIDLPVPRDR